MLLGYTDKVLGDNIQLERNDSVLTYCGTRVCFLLNYRNPILCNSKTIVCSNFFLVYLEDQFILWAI